jgi:RNA polymerase sigma-70 factor (ECF subfamily)
MPDETANDELMAMLDTVGKSGFTYAWQLLRNRDDALDVVQSALTALWRTRRRLQTGRDPRGWFYRILRNKCIDVLRSRKLHSPDALITDPPAPNPHDPAAITTRHEDMNRLRQALAELSDEMREIILLRDYHDLSYADISHVLSIPIGTVMSRLHRARSALCQRLQEGVSHD